MRKDISINLVVAALGVTLFIVGNKLFIYMTNGDTYLLFPYRVLISILIPILLGVIITVPYRDNRTYEGSFDWAKFIIQGIPALLMAVRLEELIFVMMKVFGIGTLDLGFFNYLVSALYQAPVFHAAFGVWFGKVLVECFGSRKEDINL